MKKNITALFLLVTGFIFAQQTEDFKITDEWLAKIERMAPSEPTVKNVSKKKILVFSKATGFDHWTIPHNAEMLKILGTKTDAFEVHIAYDVESFDKKNLKKYDAVVFNNCNPSGPKRDLFWDLLQQNSNLPDQEITALSKQYETNLMNYVAKGGGLMILHGAITVQNNSKEFSQMTGGSFDYHPRQQEMHVKEVDPKHPLVQAFKGNGLTHVDEPYFFNNAYFDYNFRPLLYIEIDKLEGMKKEVGEKVNYVSWIKRHGKGRVFYSSPSHNAQSLDHPELLQFFLDGLQYVVGDLKCDDSPIGK
ncbi:ThuA domain-containing protein [Zobellia galactanivorans]|uniref:ThuA domain-containing protein n=1 Tax=Zobellia galactanivorans (strain DSM 12802 / CCUG 47099 / CIP 106680 / NCIMB 13871 / Dsij) TaxID=63186 RepID=UPI001C07D14E|nr:ThuA domain-containing protein [Zobellia galactanivorans]MBU3025290.1 ThuA domain-containing protein [Zobellia galactanivorans]